MNHVYHSSKIQGLKKIKPQVSTHGECWIYAMEKPEHALLFIGNYSDAVNQIGFFNKKLQIVERFKNSLEHAYANKTGSIYTLPGTDFKKNMTHFKEEIICDHECEVIAEEKIENILERILSLEKQEEIRIYRFPNTPSWLKI